MTRAALLSMMLAAVALAGCSEAPPSGELSFTGHAIVVDGSVTLTYQPAQNPFPQSGGTPLECANDNDPTGQLPRCEPASTNVSAHLMEFPSPGGGSYTLWFTGADSEVQIGSFADEGGMYTLDALLQEDLDGMYDMVEIRYEGFAVATASAAGGTNAFGVAEAAAGVTVAGGYSGTEITVDVTGLPDVGVAYKGWLVEENAETGLLEHTESFNIVPDGTTTYQASKNIADFAEFHIHVGASKVNVAVSTIETA